MGRSGNLVTQSRTFLCQLFQFWKDRREDFLESAVAVVMELSQLGFVLVRHHVFVEHVIDETRRPADIVQLELDDSEVTPILRIRFPDDPPPGLELDRSGVVGIRRRAWLLFLEQDHFPLVARLARNALVDGKVLPPVKVEQMGPDFIQWRIDHELAIQDRINRSALLSPRRCSINFVNLDQSWTSETADEAADTL